MPFPSDSDIEKFKELATSGMNCKQMAKYFGISPQSFGIKIKEKIGLYPSQYLVKIRK